MAWGGGWVGGWVGGKFNSVVGPLIHGPPTYGLGGLGGFITLLARSWPVSICFLACASSDSCRGYGPDIMACEDVAVVCLLVLLLRLGRFPEPDGFAELRPLFRVNAHTLDAYVSGLCVDVRDTVQRFVVETTLQVERSWVNSKGAFSSIGRVCRSRVGIHTGGIDAIWKQCKKAIPSKRAAGSPHIPKYMQAFRWRFCKKLPVTSCETQVSL